MQDLALRFIDLLKSEYADNLNEAVLQSFEKVVGDYQKVPALLIVVDSRDLAIRKACPYNFFAGNDIGRKARKDRGRLRLCKRQHQSELRKTTARRIPSTLDRAC